MGAEGVAPRGRGQSPTFLRFFVLLEGERKKSLVPEKERRRRKSLWEKIVVQDTWDEACIHDRPVTKKMFSMHRSTTTGTNHKGLHLWRGSEGILAKRNPFLGSVEEARKNYTEG